MKWSPQFVSQLPDVRLDDLQCDGFFETSQDLFFCFHLNLYSTLVSENGKRDMLSQTSKYSEKGGELDICASILYF